jgi:hypothetical protein
VRAFVVVDWTRLTALWADGRLSAEPGAPLDGYAATPALAARLELGDEELEYALATAAKELAGERLVAAGQARGRRVVLVVEVPTADVAAPDGGELGWWLEDESAGEMALTRLPLARVEAVLVDEHEVPTQGAGPDPTTVAGDELSWFAVQELSQLLGGTDHVG